MRKPIPFVILFVLTSLCHVSFDCLILYCHVPCFFSASLHCECRFTSLLVNADSCRCHSTLDSFRFAMSRDSFHRRWGFLLRCLFYLYFCLLVRCWTLLLLRHCHSRDELSTVPRSVSSECVEHWYCAIAGLDHYHAPGLSLVLSRSATEGCRLCLPPSSQAEI